MSQLEDDVPPTGEQLHMPNPSLLPVLLAVRVGAGAGRVTVSIILTIVGLLITIPVIVLWIRSARDETAELPPGH